MLAALSGLTAVAVGAFGAHGVDDPQVRAWLQTGGQYQLPHAAAVFACFTVWRAGGGRAARAAAWLFLAGALIFSGSLYALAATGLRAFGAATPVGGVLLMAGWAVLAWAGSKVSTQPTS